MTTRLNSKRNGFQVKQLVVPVIVMLAFWGVAIYGFSASGNTFPLIMFGYIGASLGIGLDLYGTLPKKQKPIGRRLTLLVGLFLLGLWLLTYGLSEETGWRGFALPHLQKNRSAASATLILALLWACWHLPAFFFRDTYVEMGLLGFPLFAFMMIFSTMVFTWLYNSTRGSIFIVAIFHAVFNWLGLSEAAGPFATSIMSAPIVLWALYVARRYGQENASPLVKQMA